MDVKQIAISPRYRALLQLLRTADAVWNLSRIFFAEWNLSPSQFNVLNVLLEEPQGISQIELGRVLITHRSNVTGLVVRLQRRGLVQRRRVTGDKRAYSLLLTVRGRQLLHKILPAYYERAESIWEGLPAKQAALLTEELGRLETFARDQTAIEEPS